MSCLTLNKASLVSMCILVVLGFDGLFCVVSIKINMVGDLKIVL